MNDIILKAEGIYKEFSGNKVLKNVTLDIRKGEILSLLGENGAGKSTLIKIISGIYPLDAGKIYIDDKPVEIKSRQDSMKHGIAVVYQDLSVMSALTVAQNIMIGREKHRFGFLESRKMNTEVQELIDKYGFHLKATDLVNDLSVAERQMVEILKALSLDARILILDEPTAALSISESEVLFKIIRNLRDMGVSILYISHRMDEVYMLSDRITVLRDGVVADVFEKDEIDPAKIVRSIIGQEFSASERNELAPGDGEVILDVQNFCHGDKFSNISFQLHKGEILGIGGLVGAGRTEFLRSLYGLDDRDSGTALLYGKPLSRDIKKNINAGVGFISEDRRGEGMIPIQSIAVNSAMVNFDKVMSGPFISSRKEQQSGRDLIDAMKIQPADPTLIVSNLSGGNQQKVVVGKWLQREVKLLLIDEPTVGVDIGAKAEIYAIIRKLAEKGVGIILVSSDVEELLNISTRILMFYRGKIVKEYDAGKPSQDEIMMAASNSLKEDGK